MKRVINAAHTQVDEIHPAFYELQVSARSAGYTLSVSGDNTMTLVADDQAEYMPTITVETEADGDAIYFVPTLSFPTLTSDATTYSDTVAYWISRWTRVGKFITELSNFTFNPYEYEA